MWMSILPAIGRTEPEPAPGLLWPFRHHSGFKETLAAALLRIRCIPSSMSLIGNVCVIIDDILDLNEGFLRSAYIWSQVSNILRPVTPYTVEDLNVRAMI